MFIPLGAMFPTVSKAYSNGGSGSDYDGTFRFHTATEDSNHFDLTDPQMDMLLDEARTSAIHCVHANYGDGILCMNGTTPCNGENLLYGWVSSAPYTFFFVNLNATVGPIGSGAMVEYTSTATTTYTVVLGPVDWSTRVFLENYKEAVQWVGYSPTTGKYLWTAPPQQALDYYGSTSAGVLPGAVYCGNLYSSAYGGTVYCYNDLTGALLWTYGNGGAGNSTNAGFNYPYGDYPTQINAIGNGIIYLVTSAHTLANADLQGCDGDSHQRYYR